MPDNIPTLIPQLRAAIGRWIQDCESLCGSGSPYKTPEEHTKDIWFLCEHLQAIVDAAERGERAERAIESFGNTKEFDWKVLAKIDEQEREVKRLNGVIATIGIRCKVLCPEADAEIEALAARAEKAESELAALRAELAAEKGATGTC